MSDVIYSVSKAAMNLERIGAAKRRMEDRVMFKQAGYVRIVARRSIRPRKKASAPGSPPSTQTKRLPNSIIFHVFRGQGRAIVGPSASIVGEAGAAHERGELFRGDQYPARPFMFPALVKSTASFPAMFAGQFY